MILWETARSILNLADMENFMYGNLNELAIWRRYDSVMTQTDN